MAEVVNSRKSRRTYLLQECILFLLLAYVLLIGAGYGGLITVPLVLVNTGMLIGVGVLWLTLRLLRRWPFPHTSLDVPLLVCLVAVAVTAAFSIDPRRSAGAVWRAGLYALVYYLFIDLLRHDWPAELFVKVLLIVGAIVLAFALLHLVSWYKAWYDIWAWARPIPAFGVRVQSIISTNFLAAFVNLLWPMAFLRLTHTEERLPRFLLTGWLSVAAIVMYFTSSRGGWLGAAAGGGLLALYDTDLARLKYWFLAKRWRVLLGSLVIALVLALLINRQASRIAQGSRIGYRLHIWRAAWTAFQRSPIVGTGPFTYGETYLAARSVPPDPLHSHAHNHPINLAAESGLLGLGALAWLTVGLARHLWIGWQGTPAAEKHVKLGTIAALTTCAVHSQFDCIARLPYMVVVLAFLVAVLVKDHVPDKGDAGSPLAGTWLFLVGWGLLVFAAIWSLKASYIYSKGVSAANSGDWSRAAGLLDQAVERDSQLAYYQLQAAYAHGVIAGKNSDELGEAIGRYQTGIEKSPNYAVNAANLSALFWEAGRVDQALTWMERAVELAPRSALFHLNLGRLHEELGHELAASTHYSATLENEPDWAAAYFWRVTPLRAAAKEKWNTSTPDSEPVVAAHTAWYKAGCQAMAEGRERDALHAFRQATSLKPRYDEAYVGQAEASIALGHEQQAERLLRTAILAGGSPRARIALAQLYHEQGKVREAIEFAEEALHLDQEPYMGLADVEAAHYGWRLFYRQPIRSSLLPPLTTIAMTDEIADYMLELATWYEQVGDRGAAVAVYQQVLEAVPDSEAARRRLAALRD